MIKQKTLLEKSTDTFSNAGEKLGVLLMSAAILTGVLEFVNHNDNKIVLTNQTTLSYAGENTGSNPIRREKGTEEVGGTHFSYGISQRTPSRSGR